MIPRGSRAGHLALLPLSAHLLPRAVLQLPLANQRTRPLPHRNLVPGGAQCAISTQV